MNFRAFISVKEIAKGQVLAGAGPGREFFLRALGQLPEVGTGPILLDFSGVSIATVSWLREGVLALQAHLGSCEPHQYLVVANANPIVQEELQAALAARATAILTVGYENQRIHHPVIRGHLDPSLHDTLLAIEGKDQIDAPSLKTALPFVAPTAINNRLSSLESKGFLKSTKHGRIRVYEPVVKGITYGR